MIALAGGALLHHDMVSHGLDRGCRTKSPSPRRNAIVNNVVLLVQSYANLAGGNFFGAARERRERRDLCERRAR